MPGTVASSTPPGARIRWRVATAACTSKIRCSVWVRMMQSKASDGMWSASARSATIVACGSVGVNVQDVAPGHPISAEALGVRGVAHLEDATAHIRGPVGQEALDVVAVDRLPALPAEVRIDRSRPAEVAESHPARNRRGIGFRQPQHRTRQESASSGTAGGHAELGAGSQHLQLQSAGDGAELGAGGDTEAHRLELHHIEVERRLHEVVADPDDVARPEGHAVDPGLHV